MRSVVVTRRYARALYELAQETNSVDDVLIGLSNLNSCLKTTPELGRALFNPLIKPGQKQALVKTITSNKLILKFIYLLAKRKRLRLIQDVYEHYSGLVDQAKGVQRVQVKTALFLSEDQKRKVESSIALSMGGNIVGQFEVAKDLIGGVWVKMGDKVWDATLRGKIDDLRHTLVNSAN